MTLTELLAQEARHTYEVTRALMKMVEPNDLDWKPATGHNWMKVSQLLMHCTNACGSGVKGFVTGDWGLQDKTFEDLPADQALPPAEALPCIASVDEALRLLSEDEKLALRFLEQAGEANLLGKRLAAPWGGPELTLFQHLLHMIGHLEMHKSQLFYYLKLLGRRVDTSSLWGA